MAAILSRPQCVIQYIYHIKAWLLLLVAINSKNGLIVQISLVSISIDMDTMDAMRCEVVKQTDRYV